MAFRFKKGRGHQRRPFVVATWREGPALQFKDAERAALALSEAVTRMSDRPDPVPDEIWEARHHNEPQLACLVLWIAMTNVWNRLNVTTSQVAQNQRT